jgi:uncharacterized protein YlxW (UPF0749 family)
MALAAALLGFVASLQLRSEAAVVRTLSGQSDSDLALLIDDLNRGNFDLLQQQYALSAQLDTLRSAAGGDASAAASSVQSQLQQLQIALGALPVHGPGTVLTVDGQLGSVDVADLVDALMNAGAEALDINGVRVVQGSVITGGAGAAVDSHVLSAPITVTAIGDPQSLAAEATLVAGPLRERPGVRSVAYVSRDSLVITSVRAARAEYYAHPA